MYLKYNVYKVLYHKKLKLKQIETLLNAIIVNK